MKKTKDIIAVSVDVKIPPTRAGQKSVRKTGRTMGRTIPLLLTLTVMQITSTACYLAVTTNSIEPVERVMEPIRVLLSIIGKALI